MMRLVQMIWQVLMILISVYIGWLFIRCMRRYSDSHKEKKGDKPPQTEAVLLFINESRSSNFFIKFLL